MKIPISIVNAFTLNDQPFSGNPASVCILNFDDDISDDVKQKIAAEMNLTGNAFVAKAWSKGSKQEPNTFTIRWFTAATELKLCGHATIAASRALFDSHLQNCDTPIKFETKFKDTLRAVPESSRQRIAIELPLSECKPIEQNTNPWLEDIVQNILGIHLNSNIVREVQVSVELKYLLICLKDDQDYISKVSPNFSQLLRIQTNDSVKLVIVTQKPNQDNNNNIQFLSRIFAPWLGFNEDPVCGSAHTLLAPYWQRQYLESGVQMEELVGKQCSERGGIVGCKIVGERVQLIGKTRKVVTGVITI